MTAATLSSDLTPVLYADDDVVIVDKPAGMVVHPTYKNAEGTLLDVLRQQLPDPPSLVGRLDRWTSGIVVVARNSAVHAALQRETAAPDCHKDYMAVAHGCVEDAVEIDLRLRLDERDRRRVVASTDAGAPSRTLVTPIGTANLKGCVVSLLSCRLLTGRRHQIRVHLAARGWPVVGDSVYGDARADKIMDSLNAARRAPARHALHAWRLQMTHPFTRARLKVTAPVPEDLKPLLRAFEMQAFPSVA
ncbi:MAG TPA: RluA family pseudouridine synthase [Vicinamibacterales bacterium]